MSFLNKFKGKSVVDLFWSFADNILQQSINFVVGIVLARLLLPQEFGLVGIITVFITLSNVFVDGGFSAALINKKNIRNIDYNTVFYTNIGISVVLYVVLFFTSERISMFFNNPQISNLLRVAGLNIMLISLSAVHRVIIVRNLNFKLITIISLIAVSISAVCAICMAYNGYGVYSLIYRVIIGQIVTVLLFWILNKWKPSFEFSLSSFKEMFSYGVNLLVSNLLNTLHSNIYYIIIGKFFSSSQLGYYTRATTFRDLASTNISNTIKRVSFSTLSKINDEALQFKKFNFFRDVTFLLTSLTMLLLFFMSKEIILILLSEKWLDSIEILQIISVTGIFVALYNLNIDYIAVRGNTRLYLLIEVIGKILVIPIIIIGVLFGFKMFLYSIIVQNVVMFLIVTQELNKLIKGVFKDQVLLLIRYALMFFILLLFMKFELIKLSNIYISLFVKSIFVLCIYTVFNYKQLKNITKR